MLVKTCTKEKGKESKQCLCNLFTPLLGLNFRFDMIITIIKNNNSNNNNKVNVRLFSF